MSHDSRKKLLIRVVSSALTLGLVLIAMLVISASASASKGDGQTISSQDATKKAVASQPAQPTGTKEEDKHPGPYPVTITSIDAQTIIGTTPSGATFTIHTNAETQYVRGGVDTERSTFQVGMQVFAKGDDETATSVDAFVVFVELPNYGGEITAISGNTLTVQGSSHSYTVIVTASTVIQAGKQTIQLSGLHVGDMIAVEGQLNNDTVTAASIGVKVFPNGDETKK